MTVFKDIPNQAGSSLAYSPSVFFDIRDNWKNSIGSTKFKKMMQEIKIRKIISSFKKTI